jgi:cytochrome b subunit of formate dehydrogenase
MIVHNLLVLRRKFLIAWQHKGRTVIRMTLSQRIQHFLLLSSFITLAVTGFALKYPDSWIRFLVGSSENIRRLGHRGAAVVMLALAIYHTGYLILTKDGRKLVKDLFPCWKDVLDVLGNVRYLLLPKAQRPAFARFGYGEKAEYWAVVWGTVIMGLTGLIIWFKMSITEWAPRWVIDVATTIHYYEAILAVLAIIVWHFYHVIFDPDVYPMNTAWLTGRMPEHLYQEEHPLDTETLAKAQDATPHEPGKGTPTDQNEA